MINLEKMSDCEVCGAAILLITFVVTEVSARECYNYKEEPEVRHCSTGCCGDKYKEYCCNATMQIVGSVLGGLVVMSAVIALAYYCYRKKSKGRQVTGEPGIFGRIGFRSRQNHIHQVNRVPPQVPRGRPFRIPTNSNFPAVGANTFCNPTYNPGHEQRLTNAPFYDRNGPPTAPTAPLPPPYDMTTAPPPYSINTKQWVPPPPEYTAIIGQTNTLGFKPGGYSDGMPPPSH